MDSAKRKCRGTSSKITSLQQIVMQKKNLGGKCREKQEIFQVSNHLQSKDYCGTNTLSRKEQCLS
jgi:ribosomal protein S8E